MWPICQEVNHNTYAILFFVLFMIYWKNDIFTISYLVSNKYWEAGNYVYKVMRRPSTFRVLVD